MADNYLERHREEYEKRKIAWVRKQKHLPIKKIYLKRPEDESL